MFASQEGAQGKKGSENPNKGMIIMKENIAQGNPKLSLYLSYFEFCGGKLFSVLWILLSVAWQGLSIAQSFTLRQWVNEVCAPPA